MAIAEHQIHQGIGFLLNTEVGTLVIDRVLPGEAAARTPLSVDLVSARQLEQVAGLIGACAFAFLRRGLRVLLEPVIYILLTRQSNKKYGILCVWKK
jgi:hypothetical protein